MIDNNIIMKVGTKIEVSERLWEIRLGVQLLIVLGEILQS